MVKQFRLINRQNIITLLLLAIITGILSGMAINIIMGEFSPRFLFITIFNSLFLSLGVALSYFIAAQLLTRISRFLIILLSFLLIFGISISGFIFIIITNPLIFLIEAGRTSSYLVINLLFILALALYVINSLTFQKRITETELQALEQKTLRQEIEKKMLISQINPHFLFNSLNLVLSLLPEQRKAEQVLLDLSNFLRYSLEASRKQSIPLSEELNQVEQYLNIQQLRYGKRLSFRLEGRAVTTVPPLLLQPLVENCVKHNIQERSPIQVRVATTRNGNQTRIRIEDNRKLLEADHMGAGIGLSVTKKRVELAGGDFNIEEGGVTIIFYD